MIAEARLQAGRAELARFVHLKFRYSDEAATAVLRTFVGRLADDLDWRQ